ncbi:MAG: transposase family protein, partial [Geminicoccaceae bacterium]|nr:transposase family protein [Geminicoccaceae bacterium]
AAPPILFLGLDVHKETVVSAVLPEDAPTPRQIDTVPHDLGRLKRYLDRLARDGAEVRCVYEASGAGYVLQRAIQSWGYHCDVCAPSLTPKRPGHQRKHNRYDAKELARYYRSGDLALIALPTEAEERVRDLVRCRTNFQRELHRARQYVLKFCTRRGLRYAPAGVKKCHWTRGHRAWLQALRTGGALEGEDRAVLGEYLALMEYAEGRRDALDARLEALVLAPALRAAVTTLGAFRGIDAHAALVLGVEVRDWRRFTKGTQPMAYVGLVPREDSSAEERRGSITKMGNSHCRHVLVQAAWAYRHPPRVGQGLKARQAGADARVVALSWKAQHRLHRLYKRLAAKRGAKVAVVAVARELVGFLWAAMTLPAAAA